MVIATVLFHIIFVCYYYYNDVDITSYIYYKYSFNPTSFPLSLLHTPYLRQ